MATKQLVSKAYLDLLNNKPAGENVVLVPSWKDGNTQYGYKNNRVEQGKGYMEYLNKTLPEIIKPFIFANDADKINFIKREVIKSLYEPGGTDTLFEIQFKIEWSGKVQIGFVSRKGYPSIGKKSTYVRHYYIPVIVKTTKPDRAYTKEEPFVGKIEDDVNAEYYFKEAKKEFEKRIIDIPERILRKIKEYVDPPTNQEIINIGRIA
jgi:hypothetical protein